MKLGLAWSLAAALGSAALLGGCALRPMYGGGQSSPVAATLRSIEVQPIAGQIGWLVRNAVVDRIGGEPASGARYRLEVELDDDIIGLGIRGDSTATRERRTLRARFRLVEAASGAVVLDASAGSDAGIDVVGSEYATVAAEQSAGERLSGAIADQIVARLGLYAARQPARR